MAKESVKIELTESDIKKIVAEKYNLNEDLCDISMSHYSGDSREGTYITIIVTGPRNNLQS